MARINNPMEIFKLLNGSNCRECNEKTCLAFAVAVFKEKRPIHACPHLDKAVIDKYSGAVEKPNTIDEFKEEAIGSLKQEIAGANLAEAAERIGADFSNGRLTLKVFGKEFGVDTRGNLSSDVHINAYMVVPVLNHILNGKGCKPKGEWITFRELSGGPPRYAHFQQRCENPLKKVADTYTDLFQDMLDIFDGKQVDGHVNSDISILLHPLPRFPMLVCYWKPEDGIDSSLHIYFDTVSDDNLDIESIYTMNEGIAMMFEKIALRHGA
ncbi:MAG TPA: Fe-S cluster protein [Desulfobacteraceae bacterium]|nr:Fe-S cluster protein [Desulfobacteraceae bacterium]